MDKKFSTSLLELEFELELFIIPLKKDGCANDDVGVKSSGVVEEPPVRLIFDGEEEGKT